MTPNIPKSNESTRNEFILSLNITIENIKAKSGAVIVRVVNSGNETNCNDKNTINGVGRKTNPLINGTK